MINIARTLPSSGGNNGGLHHHHHHHPPSPRANRVVNLTSGDFSSQHGHGHRHGHRVHVGYGNRRKQLASVNGYRQGRKERRGRGEGREETNIIYKSIKSIWLLRPNKLPTGRTGQIGILLRITHAADQL